MPPSKRKEWLQIGSGQGYFHRVHHPLQCLIFIAPLLLIYQVGSVFYARPAGAAGPIHVIAFTLMLDFFRIFGAVGNYLPLLTVIAILLAWHVARHDKWDFDPWLYFGMAMESIGWAIPIYVLSLAVVRHSAAAWNFPAAATPHALPWQTQAVLSVGAGIYEELLFRLVGITLLNIILVDLLKIKTEHAIPIIIVVSAVVFAAYHFLGDTPMSAPYFLFLTLFGIYAAGIFIFRGFGIVVVMHALYDLIVVAMTLIYAHR